VQRSVLPPDVLLRVTWPGCMVADCRSIDGIAKYEDLTSLVDEQLAGT
jgi:hypothetical protein